MRKRTFNNEKNSVTWSALHALRAFQGKLRGPAARKIGIWVTDRSKDTDLRSLGRLPSKSTGLA